MADIEREIGGSQTDSGEKNHAQRMLDNLTTDFSIASFGGATWGELPFGGQVNCQNELRHSATAL